MKNDPSARRPSTYTPPSLPCSDDRFRDRLARIDIRVGDLDVVDLERVGTEIDIDRDPAVAGGELRCVRAAPRARHGGFAARGLRRSVLVGDVGRRLGLDFRR
ncbi:MAG: hypothetical protein ABJE66_02215 [Deltaproteobacteria bacterium]